MTETKTERPYGSWDSPITASFITNAGVSLGSLGAGSSSLVWLERRPLEKGRVVLVRHSPSAETAGVDVVPSDHNVRTRVHEYGGGPYAIGTGDEGNDFVVYSDFSSQRLYRLSLAAAAGATPLCLTPPSDHFPEKPRALFRFADGVIDQRRNRLICVREDHTNPELVVNTVATVKLDGSGEQQVLVQGSDFYASPRLSPDGSKLTFMHWNFPEMPWTATQLSVVDLDTAAGQVVGEELKVAGFDERASVQQPQWSPSGELHFLSDAANGFWNIYVFREGQCKNILEEERDFSGSCPGWRLGRQGYHFMDDGGILGVCKSATGCGSSLLVLKKNERPTPTPAYDVRREFTMQDGLPYSIDELCCASDGTLFMLGTSPCEPSGIYKWEGLKADLEVEAEQKSAVLVVSSSDLRVGAENISKPEAVTFPTGPWESQAPGNEQNEQKEQKEDGEEDSASTLVHAYYYAPKNGKFAGPADALPPLLVKAHGGPTGAARTSFNPSIQFWTSRGFAVIDVDYRGSMGYGRAYRMALQGKWGVYDVQDVVAAANYPISRGLADPKRIAIDGGSAGGYTTLGALAWTERFNAGCSLYGISDLSVLARDTHKFESRYLDGLIGRLPEDKEIFEARAPINAADSLSCPVLLLQGDEDKVVPPNQAQLMYNSLKTKGIPTALKMYAGEQHGFRKAENIQDALNSELYFYSQIFGFDASWPGGDVPAFPIDNFSA